jgi:hypothetical protein
MRQSSRTTLFVLEPAVNWLIFVRLKAHELAIEIKGRLKLVCKPLAELLPFGREYFYKFTQWMKPEENCEFVAKITKSTGYSNSANVIPTSSGPPLSITARSTT